jgi:hypothetical protein
MMVAADASVTILRVAILAAIFVLVIVSMALLTIMAFIDGPVVSVITVDVITIAI